MSSFHGTIDWEEDRKRLPPPAALPASERPTRAGLAPGQFRMWAVRGDLNLACLLGPSLVRPVRGYGGWTQREREGRRARPHFAGSDLPAFSIEVLLENERVPTPGG